MQDSLGKKMDHLFIMGVGGGDQATRRMFPSGRVLESGARGPGFDTYICHVVSLSRTIQAPLKTVNDQEAGGSIST